MNRAVEAAGGKSALARRLGTSRQAVDQWPRVPAERVLAVEKAAGGAVTRYELRPDIYPRDDVVAEAS
jgi:DNA-binding transcriptional regulator YdaS (Cro superfamily)